MNNKCRLLVTCDDKPGIVAKISGFLQQRNANIIELDQHSSAPTDGTFFLRLEFQLDASSDNFAQLQLAFEHEVAKPLKLSWTLSDTSVKKKLALFVSKHDHALIELLWLWQKNELDANIEMVISNHPDLENVVKNFGIDYHCVPINKENKKDGEAKILSLLDGKASCLVLARYMQILSADFCSHFNNRIINIHHSFLPAFVGADPYQQAFDYGVKIIGATAHFVTAKLDAGPIIEQDVAHVSHKLHKEDLRRLGRDLERRVLARAVRWFTEDRIIVDDNKTVVFN